MKKIFLLMLAMGLGPGCTGGNHLPATLSIGQTTVALGDVPLGENAVATFAVSNAGDEDLEILSTTFSEGDPDLWRLDTDGGPILGGGESMSLLVSFEPRDLGDQHARVQVRSTDTVTGPLTVDVTASGSPSIADEDDDGYSPADGDCDDSRAEVHPGAPEICDGRDDDCNGDIPADEADGDHDGVRICEGDCDDGDRNVYPGAPEICDGKDSNCSGNGNQDDADVDGDGVSICQGDCDDGEALAFPGNPEVCGDGIDNDCSGAVDDLDADQDGHSVCSAAGDCNDDDASAYPVVVDAAAPAGGDGTDATPFRTFSAAYAALDTTCRTIWLADGIYHVQETLGVGDDVTVQGQSTGVELRPPEAGTGRAGRIFTVNTGATLAVQTLTLTLGDVDDLGGAIQVAGGAVTLQDVDLVDNASVGDGGAISVKGSGSLDVTGGTFSGDTAGGDGGAVALSSGSVTVSGTTFTSSHGARGGAVYVGAGSVSLGDVLFDGNDASSDGGALYVESASSTLDVFRSTFWRNSSTGAGGALALVSVQDPTGQVANNLFQNNTAGSDGGAVSVSGTATALVLANNTMFVNNASGDGSDVFVAATDASGLQVLSNIGAWGNADSGVYVAPGSGATVAYNLVFSTSGPTFAGDAAAGTDDNLEQNPVFTDQNDNADPTDDDLTLQSNSPAVDSGPPNSAFDDCDGSQNDRGYTGGPNAAGCL